MHYDIVELPARTVVGPAIRLSNGSPDEGSAIGQLWQRFMEEGMDRAIPGAQADPYGCFGLYFDYDLNEMSYDMLVGCETDAVAPGDMRAQAIPAGRYAKFSVRGGDCVKSVQDVWAAVWADEELAAKRAFTVDFEAYLPGGDLPCADIDIFVALR